MYFVVTVAFDQIAQGDIIKVEVCDQLGPDDIGLFQTDGYLQLARKSIGLLVGKVAKQIISY